MTKLKLLSGGAVKRGVAQIAEAYARATGTSVDVAFTQGPRLRQRILAGEHADVVVAPPKVMDEFAAAGKVVPATRALVGRARVGVVVHRDVSVPDVSDTEAFKRALLAASVVVHNDASSGVYIAELLERLGLKAQLGGRIVVVGSGSAIMETVAARAGSADFANGAFGAIGMAQISEIRVMIDKGCAVKLAAPLPDAIQHMTAFHAAACSASAAPEAAAALARELTSAAAKPIFAATGID